MSRRLIALVILVVGGASAAQAQEDSHTFQVINGEIYVDGTLVPGAVPDGLDLDGFNSEIVPFPDRSLPILEVGDQVYVLEDGRLVLFEQSSRQGQGVYVLYPGDSVVEGLPEERTMPIVEEVYMREVEAQNQTLYDRLRTEREMDQDAEVLGARIRSLPDGPDRDRLRDELRALLSDLLTLKHEARAAEITLAQTRLDALRKNLSDRAEQHDAIVDHRLRQLCGEE